VWINGGRRPEQSSRIAGLGALKGLTRKIDENMMYWMGKGEEKLQEFVD